MPSIPNPNMTEIATTTARNRSSKKDKAPKKSAHKEKFAGYEGTPQDEKEDKRGAKKLGITPEEYEGSPQDEKEDKEGMKRGKGASKGQGMHLAIMISPMSNPFAEHKASVRKSIKNSIKQIKGR